jgi:hypothetical protein
VVAGGWVDLQQRVWSTRQWLALADRWTQQEKGFFGFLYSFSKEHRSGNKFWKIDIGVRKNMKTFLEEE